MRFFKPSLWKHWRRTMDVKPYIQRAVLADEKIKILSEKVAQLKDGAAAKAIAEEEKKLQAENELIKKEIEDLKMRLAVAEIQNGKMQVPMPSRSTTQVGQNATNVAKATSKKPEESNRNAGTGDGAPSSKKQKTEKPKKKPAPKNTKADNVVVDVSRLDFCVARIVTATKHPDADTLYVENAETGEEKNRTVISGLVDSIPIEEMQNRMVILMMNLKPVKMRGILSEAMVMCACAPEKTEILAPPPGCIPGDRVTFDGYPGEPDAQLNPKKKVWEQVQPFLKTDGNRVACYKGVPFTVKGKGIVTSQTLANCAIK